MWLKLTPSSGVDLLKAWLITPFDAHVVQQRIAVANLQRLADAHAEHARRVAALVLIEHHRLGRNREAEAAEAVLHVDEDVLQRLVLADDDAFRRRAAARRFRETHFGSPVDA